MEQSIYSTIREDDGCVIILDQTLLPEVVFERRLTSVEEVVVAIRDMQVRGAPLIGACAAYGVAIGLTSSADEAALDRITAMLSVARPTAVNLRWALQRMKAKLAPLPIVSRQSVAWQEARAIATEDAVANASIGINGLALIEKMAMHRNSTVNVMTHCNAGWLATVSHGTALAPIYAAHEMGIRLHVWVSETRPRNQGRLTAWELSQSQVPHTLITDNAAGLLMMRGQVDMIIVGADRISANGDIANKVGTYLKALAARAHGIPFYVAAPFSTIDLTCQNGAAIPIEDRDAAELGAKDTHVINPAFDITPASLIDGIITQHGILMPTMIQSYMESINDGC